MTSASSGTAGRVASWVGSMVATGHFRFVPIINEPVHPVAQKMVKRIAQASRPEHPQRSPSSPRP